jgi:hypothetical protein
LKPISCLGYRQGYKLKPAACLGYLQAKIS